MSTTQTSLYGVGFIIIICMIGSVIANNITHAYIQDIIVTKLDCNGLKQWVLDDKIGWDYAKAKYEMLGCKI